MGIDLICRREFDLHRRIRQRQAPQRDSRYQLKTQTAPSSTTPTATYPGATPEDASKILGTLLERGGNFVDTANFYTRGHSEKIIGDFIAQDRAASSEWFWPKALCSKFSVLNYSGRDRMQDEVEHYPVAVPR
jgi:predicted aldo/keto reductase-like oxidoreductase